MKILVGLLEHFGDIIACEPVARYLRAKYPKAHLSWAVRSVFRELVDFNPHVDETLVLGCLTDWIKLRKHAKYDLVIDLHVNLRVCEDCRVPLIKDQGNPFVNAYEWFDYGAILEAFCLGAGLPKLSAQPRVYIEEQHREFVDGLQLPSQYCTIHRESNAPLKDWPEQKWYELVHFIQHDLKIPVVEVGSKKGHQTQKSQPVMRNGTASLPRSRRWIDLTNKTSLLETAEVIRRATFYIGIDSGPAHAANAVKTPGIVLLGRMGYFRQYNPFTGFYASNSPDVRIIRNLTGVAGELSVDEVIEGTRYLAGVLEQRKSTQSTLMAVSASRTASHTDPHYAQRVAESGFFDRAWYVTHYPEALELSLDPLHYFLCEGATAGHSPGPGFDAAWYASQRADLAGVKDCLHHYLCCGRHEGLRPCPETGYSVAEATPPIEHIAAVLANLSAAQAEAADSDKPAEIPRIFAFYLPQFHPIAENNHGHRPGFTEWDNVIRAKPLFNGHYQPRLPGELGYYDLRSVDVMREQVRLANEHGISGFCFYYYYFQGKKLLYRPIDNYLKSDIKAPFFFLWANENWSRRWDGGNDEVIIAQNHSPEDDLAFIRGLVPVFSDDRYVKVAGKPILMVYKTHLFPDIRRSTELWRDEAEKHGFPGLYLVTADDWTSDPRHPRELGFDASYEIPSNIVPEQVLYDNREQLGLTDGFSGRIVDYHKFASFHMGRPFPDYKRFRTVMAPWDNTARYGQRAMIHANTGTDAYRTWLSQALIDSRRRYVPEEQMVFLHSWNEWCEGTYVEPDGRYGRRLLQETRQAVDEVRHILAEQHCEAGMKAALGLQRLMREKDEGAARSLQAMRQQNMYLYRHLEHERAQAAQAVANATSQAAVAQAAAETAAQATLAEAAAERRVAQATAARAAAEALAVQGMARVAEAEAMAAQAVAAEAAAAQAGRVAADMLQGIFRSKSWRATEPLRAFARVLKRE